MTFCTFVRELLPCQGFAMCGAISVRHAPFPPPAHQTGRADFPHPGFRTRNHAFYVAFVPAGATARVVANGPIVPALTTGKDGTDTVSVGLRSSLIRAVDKGCASFALM
jgi:hypothetical protein